MPYSNIDPKCRYTRSRSNVLKPGFLMSTYTNMLKKESSMLFDSNSKQGKLLDPQSKRYFALRLSKAWPIHPIISE